MPPPEALYEYLWGINSARDVMVLVIFRELLPLAAQSSHRKIAVTKVAARGLRMVFRIAGRKNSKSQKARSDHGKLSYFPKTKRMDVIILMREIAMSLFRESLNGGFPNGSLGYLSTIAYDCRHFATKVPLRKGPKKAQKCTIVDDCAQIAESGLKPPFESPHSDFPDCFLWRIWHTKLLTKICTCLAVVACIGDALIRTIQHECCQPTTPFSPLPASPEPWKPTTPWQGTFLVGKRFALQRFADSRESIRIKIPLLEALGQIRANRVFPPIRIWNSRGSSNPRCYPIFWKNQFARIGPLLLEEKELGP